MTAAGCNMHTVKYTLRGLFPMFIHGAKNSLNCRLLSLLLYLLSFVQIFPFSSAHLFLHLLHLSSPSPPPPPPSPTLFLLHISSSISSISSISPPPPPPSPTQECPVLTTSQGIPIDDKTNSVTAGPRGPLLLQDTVYLDEIAHFDRERIPERVVHAKGGGKSILLKPLIMTSLRQYSYSAVIEFETKF